MRRRCTPGWPGVPDAVLGGPHGADHPPDLSVPEAAELLGISRATPTTASAPARFPRSRWASCRRAVEHSTSSSASTCPRPLKTAVPAMMSLHRLGARPRSTTSPRWPAGSRTTTAREGSTRTVALRSAELLGMDGGVAGAICVRYSPGGTPATVPPCTTPPIDPHPAGTSPSGREVRVAVGSVRSADGTHVVEAHHAGVAAALEAQPGSGHRLPGRASTTAPHETGSAPPHPCSSPTPSDATTRRRTIDGKGIYRTRWPPATCTTQSCVTSSRTAWVSWEPVVNGSQRSRASTRICAGSSPSDVAHRGPARRVGCLER